MRQRICRIALLGFILLSLATYHVFGQTSTPPANAQILFVSDAGRSRFWAHLINVDGANEYFMSIPQGNEMIVEIWSMDCSPSAGIVFDALDLYRMNTDGSNLQEISYIGMFSDVAWSPDSSRIALSGSYIEPNDQAGEIYVMNADGSKITRLTSNTHWDVEPTWSPDGQQIAFAFGDFGSQDIAVMNADGSNQMQITDSPDDDRQPAWSPDGERILFVSDHDGLDNLYTMNPDGSNVTQLTEGNGNNAYPIWSPDGNFIAFNSDRDGNGTEIYVMNADGSNAYRVTHNRHEITNRPQCWLE